MIDGTFDELVASAQDHLHDALARNEYEQGVHWACVRAALWGFTLAHDGMPVGSPRPKKKAPTTLEEWIQESAPEIELQTRFWQAVATRRAKGPTGGP